MSDNERMRKHTFTFLYIAFLSLLFWMPGSAAADTPDDVFLPQWETEAEKELRSKGLDRERTFTAPPGGFIHSPPEFGNMDGLIITWRGYTAILSQIAKTVTDNGDTAFVIVSGSSQQAQAESTLLSYGVNLARVQFMIIPSDSVWIRDYGPFFIYRNYLAREVTDIIYDRYGRWDDDDVPIGIGNQWSEPVHSSPVRLEGGNFIADGMGRCFSTDRIYEQNSAYLSQAEVNQAMKDYNGCEEMIILTRLIGDGTGHIDMFAKLLDVDTMLLGQTQPGDTNYQILEDNATVLSGMVASNGSLYEVVRIPMGSSFRTYTNSVFCNKAIIVPTYNISLDTTAQSIYQAALPGYEVTMIDASAMVGSGGAIHCITMQVPSIPPTVVSVSITSCVYDNVSTSNKLTFSLFPQDYLPQSLILKRIESAQVPALATWSVVLIMVGLGFLIRRNKKAVTVVAACILVVITVSLAGALSETYITLDPTSRAYEDTTIKPGMFYSYTMIVDTLYESQEVVIQSR